MGFVSPHPTWVHNTTRFCHFQQVEAFEDSPTYSQPIRKQKALQHMSLQPAPSQKNDIINDKTEVFGSPLGALWMQLVVRMM